MLNINHGFKTAACLAKSVLIVSALAGVTSSAEIIYDNTSTFLGLRTDEGNAEIGDQVTFAGTDRLMTEFSFEYFVSPNASGNEMFQFFVRAMDGPQNSPGTVLYSTAPSPLRAETPAGYGTAGLGGVSVLLPSTVTWSVLFSGLEGDEEAGLLFYHAPEVGSSPTFDDGSGPKQFVYRNDPTGWALVDYPGVTDNLGARFTAVPEPTTWALILGGLTGFALLRRRQK